MNNTGSSGSMNGTGSMVSRGSMGSMKSTDNVAAGLRADVVPVKAQFRPDEEIRFTVSWSGVETAKSPSFGWEVYEGHRLLVSGEEAIDPAIGASSREVAISPPAARSGAYGLFVAVDAGDGRVAFAETAFDTAWHWREAPRYGFLSDFTPGEKGNLEDVAFLNRHHINLVQFYDWMYRHDQPVGPDDEFVDPLGRSVSFAVVREKIAALRKRGIAAMAYAAIYGSLPDYAARHPEQLLYRNDGEPHSLGGFFYIMDISEDSGWTSHIVDEFARVIEAFDFDGLQLDQYGFPKKAIRRRADGDREVVALKELYPRFIDRVGARLNGPGSGVGPVGVIFNNVSNYPTHTTAGSRQDALYVEVWDPAFRYRDLKAIIDNGRKWSGKHIVLAAYLPAFHPDNPADPEQAAIGATLAMAAIFANGGYHLSLGERERVLTDPYFPKHGAYSASFGRTLQRYYDFIVMYRDLLFDLRLDDVSMAFSGGINTEIVFGGGYDDGGVDEGSPFSPQGDAGTVWTIIRELPGAMVIHLINLLDLDNEAWHKPKARAPRTVRDIGVRVENWEAIEAVYWASPDGESIRPAGLAHETAPKGEDAGGGLCTRFVVPCLGYWSMAVVKLKAGVPTGSPERQEGSQAGNKTARGQPSRL